MMMMILYIVRFLIFSDICAGGSELGTLGVLAEGALPAEPSSSLMRFLMLPISVGHHFID